MPDGDQVPRHGPAVKLPVIEMPQKINDFVASYLIQSQSLARSKRRKFLDVAPVRVKRIGRNAFLDAQVTQKRSDCRFH
jgi:hypothetical protein